MPRLREALATEVAAETAAKGPKVEQVRVLEKVMALDQEKWVWGWIWVGFGLLGGVLGLGYWVWIWVIGWGFGLVWVLVGLGWISRTWHRPLVFPGLRVSLIQVHVEKPSLWGGSVNGGVSKQRLPCIRRQCPETYPETVSVESCRSHCPMSFPGALMAMVACGSFASWELLFFLGPSWLFLRDLKVDCKKRWFGQFGMLWGRLGIYFLFGGFVEAFQFWHRYGLLWLLILKQHRFFPLNPLRNTNPWVVYVSPSTATAEAGFKMTCWTFFNRFFEIRNIDQGNYQSRPLFGCFSFFNRP